MQTVEMGRKAVERRAWDDAVSAFNEVDLEEPLSPHDLELLADAAWWSGHPDDSVDALERSFAGYLEAGSPTSAARVALLLAYLGARRLASSVFAGWKAQAERLLEDEPESGVLAHLKVLEMIESLFFRNDFESGLLLADEAVVLARRHGNRDAESTALGFKGATLISVGQWQEGMALLDEATAAALSGELNLRSASDIYCTTIAACRSMADFQRAGEWTEAADRWMTRHSVGGYPGVCGVHRAELKRLRGDWTEAEEEARKSCLTLEKYHILDGVGFAHHEVGEVRLRMGDLKGAEESFLAAYEFGDDAQPGFALLMLARGEVEEASSALARGLSKGNEGGRQDLLNRARLLPAQVEVALARDDLLTAKKAVKELDEIASEFDRPAFEAAALTARGEVALHEGEADVASEALDRAWRLWREVEFPYETARARMLLGQARAAAGDVGSARMEFGAARSTFMKLGAVLDLKRVEELLSQGRAPEEDRARVTKTLMFTDIVTSTDLVGLIGDKDWEELLRWHDKELRSVFASHRGEEVSHTGDGFFVAFEHTADAVDAAVSIQRRLADHRHEHGFSPTVRIGLHNVEVTLEGNDYRGQGVHAAARVGAVAGGEEIVITAAGLETMEESLISVSEPRTVELKGIKEPIEVYLVNWR
ncbi:MAG: adenylate/guanylate cyclase domain-containing protein [Acidimicrobiia bacterium]